MTELTYAIAELFPPQGQWSDEDYLTLETNKLIELSEGRLEVLEMPSDFHQVVVGRLYLVIALFLKQHLLGRLRVAPLRVRLWAGKFREPDLIFMANAHVDRIHEVYWDAPDLAVEVVSPDFPDRDRVTKKEEYAQAKISEYWLVDPEAKTVEVYALPADATEYGLSRKFGEGEKLVSVQFPGFELALAELFAEEE